MGGLQLETESKPGSASTSLIALCACRPTVAPAFATLLHWKGSAVLRKSEKPTMNGKVLAVAGTCAEKVSRDLTSFDRLTGAHQFVHAGPSPGVIQDPLKTR